MALRTDQMERDLRRKSFADLYPTSVSSADWELKKTIDAKGNTVWKSVNKRTGEVVDPKLGAQPQLGHAPKVIETPDGLGLIDSAGNTTNLGVPSSAQNRRMIGNVAEAMARIPGQAFEVSRGDVNMINASRVPFMYVEGTTHEGFWQIKGRREGMWAENPEWRMMKLPIFRGKQVTAKDVTDSVGQRNPDTGEIFRTIEDVLRYLGVGND